MQANLYATFRMLAGVKTVEIDLPAGATVRQAVEAIVTQLPVLRSHWLNEAGELHAHVHIFLNGEDVSTLPSGLDTALQRSDGLEFFPPVAGGQR